VGLRGPCAVVRIGQCLYQCLHGMMYPCWTFVSCALSNRRVTEKCIDECRSTLATSEVYPSMVALEATIRL
jgi:hypothetical protein